MRVIIIPALKRIQNGYVSVSRRNALVVLYTSVCLVQFIQTKLKRLLSLSRLGRHETIGSTLSDGYHFYSSLTAVSRV